MVDHITGKILQRLFPIDKIKNANGARKTIEDIESVLNMAETPPEDEIAPLMKKYMEEHFSRGIPLSYIPNDED
ncbi:MAG: hypothetical protein HQK50_12960 [Oligoflexia bacterium]|nr:hypothetical protein [Oligoflexia bacterium]